MLQLIMKMIFSTHFWKSTWQSIENTPDSTLIWQLSGLIGPLLLKIYFPVPVTRKSYFKHLLYIVGPSKGGSRRSTFLAIMGGAISGCVLVILFLGLLCYKSFKERKNRRQRRWSGNNSESSDAWLIPQSE